MADSSSEATTSPQVEADAVLPIEFHLTTASGWEYDVSVEFPEPIVEFSKDVSTSPPGETALVQTLHRPQMSYVGTLDGRTAPELLINKRPDLIWTGVDRDVLEGANGSGEGCALNTTQQEPVFTCPTPLAIDGDATPYVVREDGWPEAAADAVVSTVAPIAPDYIGFDLGGAAFEGDIVNCRLRVWLDGTVDTRSWLRDEDSTGCSVR